MPLFYPLSLCPVNKIKADVSKSFGLMIDQAFLVWLLYCGPTQRRASTTALLGHSLDLGAGPQPRSGALMEGSVLQVYKDDNHKPEMVVALSPFTALCGFVPQAELAEAFRSVPELGACVGHDLTAAITSSAPTASQPAAENGHVPLQNGNSHSSNGNHANEQASSPSEVLKAAFTALMTCDSSKVNLQA